MCVAYLFNEMQTFEKDELRNSEDSLVPNNVVRRVIKKWQLTVSGEGEGRSSDS